MVWTSINDISFKTYLGLTFGGFETLQRLAYLLEITRCNNALDAIIELPSCHDFK